MMWNNYIHGQNFYVYLQFIPELENNYKSDFLLFMKAMILWRLKLLLVINIHTKKKHFGKTSRFLQIIFIITYYDNEYILYSIHIVLPKAMLKCLTFLNC